MLHAKLLFVQLPVLGREFPSLFINEEIICFSQDKYHAQLILDNEKPI